MQQRMRLLLSMLLVLSVVIVACQGSTSTPTATPVPVATEEAVEEEATEEVVEAEATEEAVEEATEEVVEAEATEEAVEAEATEEAVEVEATEEAVEVEATEEVVEAEATEEAVEAEATEEASAEEVVAGLITSVCLVTDQGGIDDGNFNALANNGMQRAAADFGLQATVIESSVAADYAPNIQSCIDSGANVIVTVGFLMEEATLTAATANPEVYFVAIDQSFTDHPTNLVGTTFREDQAGFLAGVMAALVTETDIIAGVYGIDVPAVVKFRNGYEQGARYINPEITVLGQYTDSFVNAALGATIAEQFIGEGADVVFGAGGGTGTGGIQYAAAEGVKVIGVDQDEYYSNFDAGQSPGAENLITSALKSVDVGVYNMIAGLVGAEGFEFLGGDNYLLEAANDGIGFAPAHDADVPEEVTAQVQAVFELLKSGELETGVDYVTGALLGAEEATEEATEEAVEEEIPSTAEQVSSAISRLLGSSATEAEATEEAVETEATEEATEEAVEEEIPSTAEQVNSAISRLLGSSAVETEQTEEAEATEEEEASAEVAPTLSLGEIALFDGRFNSLIQLTTFAGLTDRFMGTDNYTIFAPTDEALDANAGIMQGLMRSPISAQSIIGAHAVEGIYTAEDLASFEGELVTLLEGAPITFSVNEEGVLVLNNDEARVVESIVASNGIIHVIDAVILEAPMQVAAQMMASRSNEEATEAHSEATEEAVEAEATEEASAEEVVAGLITSVCLVTDQGGIDDGNFNALANNGMQRAAADFGLQATVIESSVAADYAPNIQSCIDSGANVIVTVGFLMEEATLTAATANPEVYFVAIDQSFTDHPTNLVGTTFREDQAGFLAGVMAALVTETDIIAGVYGIDVPAVVKFRNGYEQGARYINPEITVLGQYTDSFVNAALGATIAEQFIGEGADVVFGAGGGTGTGGIQYAAAEGVKVIGVDQDEYYSNFDAGQSPGAENLITSALKSVDVGVYNMIAGLVGAEGFEFLGGDNYLLEAANDGIGFAPAHDADVPEEVTAQVQAVFELLKSGELETGVDYVTGALLGAEEATEEATEEAVEEEIPSTAEQVSSAISRLLGGSGDGE
jgi:basic membrane protein A